MPLRTKLQIVITLCAAAGATVLAARAGSPTWLPFCLLLVAVLVSSGLKVALPQGDGSMSLNFPFILLGIVQLSPVQAMLLAAISVAAQCRIRVSKIFTAVQIVFNVANTMLATACGFLAYAALLRAHLAPAPALAVASVSYFLWNTVSVALVLAPSRGEGALSLWRREYPWYLPFYLVGAVLASTVNWMSLRFGWGTALLLVPFVYTLYRAYMSQVSRLKERQQHLEETEALHLRTIEGLAMAIEAKDQGTHDHLFRVRHYVKAVGAALQLGKLELQALETAAFLHDIGKLAVPEHIINKPGKLTPEEFEKMKIHPVVGADILERVRFPYPVVPIVRSHHEWWNGTGYPDGLRGTDIPIGARVLTVVDCFDALVSDRPYRKGMGALQALNMIRSLSGKQFDPTIVAIFEQCHAEAESRQQSFVPADFTPLNTEVEVWRGMAPGAGYEAGSEANAPETQQSSPEVIAQQLTEAAGASLDSIASASQEAHSLFELSQTFRGSLTLEETTSVMATRLRRLIPFDVCVLYLKHGDALEARVVDGVGASTFTSQPVQLGEGISGWVAQSGKPLLNGNAAVEPGCPLTTDGLPALRSGLSIPLFNLHHDVFAVLTLYSVIADPFSRPHLRTLLAMESKLSLAVQNGLQLNRAELDGDVDFLTGLPNAKRMFLRLETELARCRELALPLGVIVCDLNGFKEVNERRGHLAGNRLLRLVAEGLRQLCSGSEIASRQGGDEFVLILPEIFETPLADRCEAVKQVIESASRRAGHGVRVTASVGAAFFPGDGVIAEDLLAAADRRMYLDKQRHYSSSTALSVEGKPTPQPACTG